MHRWLTQHQQVKQDALVQLLANHIDVLADGEISVLESLDVLDLVRVLDGEYFQGICQARRALRTFRLDRVVKQVISENSGEITDPQS